MVGIINRGNYVCAIKTKTSGFALIAAVVMSNNHAIIFNGFLMNLAVRGSRHSCAFRSCLSVISRTIGIYRQSNNCGSMSMRDLGHF